MYNESGQYIQTTLVKHAGDPRSAARLSLLTSCIPHFTHHSAADFRTVHSAFYFPHSAIPHFTGTPLTLTLIDTGGPVLTLMLGYRSLYITQQQHHNWQFCRIVCKLRLRILIYILPTISSMLSKYHFTSVYGSVNICLIIIDNFLVLPKVVKSILKTIYRICRDNKTR